MNKYDEVGVIKTLSARHDVSIDTGRKVIEVLEKSKDLGNGTWGKISYLVKYHDYTLKKTDRLSSGTKSLLKVGHNNTSTKELT